jgi:Ca2+-binding EF-hand superfamily protein
MLGERFF